MTDCTEHLPGSIFNQKERFGRKNYWIVLALVVAVVAVFGQVTSFEFVDYDDYLYVVDNLKVKTGLKGSNIIRAFTAPQAANWHPLTMVSHMLDVTLYGLNPGAHHGTSLLLHIINTILLFFCFRRMTGALYRSAFLAALFAVHPLHVESVAQVACRKDVLSAFFWLLAMMAYIHYTARPAFHRYLMVVAAMALGLMSKPVVVTLPFALLLIDYWPLDRFRVSTTQNKVSGETATSRWIGLIGEKIPLVLLTLGFSVITFMVQKTGGAVASLAEYPFGVRLANAVVSYGRYLLKTVWPARLSVLYPHPGMWPLWQVAGAVVVLLAITIATLKTVRRRPYLSVGWLWFIGTLVPVIGLVQIGEQAMADRYTYIPLIGLFVMTSWGGFDLLKSWRHATVLFFIGVPVVILLLMGLSWVQVGHWKNSMTLFGHAITVTRNNATAHNNLGLAMERAGRSDEAIRQYLMVLDLDPNRADAHNNLANALRTQDKNAEAVFHYLEALRLNPRHAMALNNLGNVFSSQGKDTQALEYYRKSIDINPAYTDAHYNIGNVMMKIGRLDEAVSHYQTVLRLDPFHLEAQNNLANVFFRLERLKDARQIFSSMLANHPENVNIRNNLNLILKMQEKHDSDIRRLQRRLQEIPQDVRANNDLADLYKQQGEFEKAKMYYEKALTINPGYMPALINLSKISAMNGEYDTARTLLRRAVSLKPDATDAYYLIAATYARQKRLNDSITWLKKAIEKGFADWARLESDPNFKNIRSTADFERIVSKQFELPRIPEKDRPH